MPDGDAWTNAFVNDTLREAMQRFESISRGFHGHQREHAAIVFFHGVAEGAKLSRDSGLEKVIQGWISATLRPKGYVACAVALGVRKENPCATAKGSRRPRDQAGEP